MLIAKGGGSDGSFVGGLKSLGNRWKGESRLRVASLAQRYCLCEGGRERERGGRVES
jgi:hypothetical protein